MCSSSTFTQFIPSVSDALFNSLRHLGFQRFVPDERLRPWVQCYWMTQHHWHSHVEASETLYPDGGTTLTFQFSPHVLPKATFSATMRVEKMVVQEAKDRIGIRFHPGGSFSLLGLNMHEVMGQELSADDLTIPSLEELREQLADVTHTHSRVTLIEQWLLKLATKKAAPGLMQQLVPSLILTQQPIEELISSLPIGRRQLERKFQQEVGCSPNQLKQFHRVKLARTLISQRPEQLLTRVAQDAGFYDQAHFIRQFYKITGQMPADYRQRKMSQIYNS